jgi:hypothetical protein
MLFKINSIAIEQVCVSRPESPLQKFSSASLQMHTQPVQPLKQSGLANSAAPG